MFWYIRYISGLEKDQELKRSQDEYKIWIYIGSKIQLHILYIIGDMIPPRQCSSLSQDSSPNMTPREKYYLSGYEGPNEIYEDVPKREWNLIFVVKFLDPNDETITHGIPYNFAMLNSPETCHLGKILISPNW